MKVNRRSAFMIALSLVGTSGLGRVRAQQSFAFDPVATAKLRAGEIARIIEESPRDPEFSEPARNAVFNTGLLLQAGLRALLPVQEREGVALPGAPSPNDPPELAEAQQNYQAVFQSKAGATPAQRAVALKAVDLAVLQLKNNGYMVLSNSVTGWVAAQRRSP